MFYLSIFFRDTDFILKRRDLQDTISLTKKHSALKKQSSSDSDNAEMTRLFSQLSKLMVQALFEKYRIDFEMFDYNIDAYLKCATDSENLMPDTINTVSEDPDLNGTVTQLLNT